MKNVVLDSREAFSDRCIDRKPARGIHHIIREHQILSDLILNYQKTQFKKTVLCSS
jgi:hypothetical protein